MFSQETKQAIAYAQNHFCARKGCHNDIHSVHHQCHDTTYNQAKYPLFLNSPMNGVGLCYDCHANFHYEFEISDSLAEVYEEYLRGLNESK